MDNPRASWAPSPVLAGLGWLLTAACAVLAVVFGLAGDGPGAVLFAVLALVAALLACYTSLARPRLAADTDGLRVRTMGGAKRFAWPEVRVRLVTTRRLGRDVGTLELEAGETLLILGRLELGADPYDVLETLDTLRPHY